MGKLLNFVDGDQSLERARHAAQDDKIVAEALRVWLRYRRRIPQDLFWPNGRPILPPATRQEARRFDAHLSKRIVAMFDEAIRLHDEHHARTEAEIDAEMKPRGRRRAPGSRGK
ncbi:MAG TPA: hypothetical protein VJS92_17620 [Candidatus Polarisedimenticolaceae bacterium]|nr:hypothetical protein [Candidatus Polarisedimenticolaceae bacterium]